VRWHIDIAMLTVSAVRAVSLLVDRAADYLRRSYGLARLVASAHPVAVRVVGAATLFPGTLLIAAIQPRPTDPLAVFVTAALVSASFVVVPARHWPSWLTLAAATAGAIVMLPAGAPEAARPALFFAMLLFSLCSEKTPVVTATAAVTITLVVAGALLDGLGGVAELSSVEALSLVLAAAALGQAIRARRAQQAMLVERARRAEQGREEEARRRVQAERLRIARELHDAVGHHVALISVQAGAMTYLLDKDSVEARESLAHIQNASEAALEELRLTVGLLRELDDHEPVQPAGRLDRLDELVASFVAMGLHVTCDVSGPVRPLPEAVDLTAFRLIQESLTNSAKHAAGTTATVRVVFRPDVLALVVEDDGPLAGGAHSRQEAGQAGHGIVGMYERAAALGGWLSAGPRVEGGFRVVAELPVRVGS
jgi:signal transduction histidine kinase